MNLAIPWVKDQTFTIRSKKVTTRRESAKQSSVFDTVEPVIIIVMAAVVGVILNLAVWFGVKVILPDAGIDLFALIAAVVSLVLLQKFHFPVQYLVPIGAAAGVAWKMVG